MAKTGKPSAEPSPPLKSTTGPTESPAESQPVGASGRRAQLNLTITEDEAWAFREWCVRHRLKQQDAFRRAFELLKREEGS
jgi:hypothetical protein